MGKMNDRQIVADQGDLGEQIRATHRELNGRAKATFESALRLGELLAEAKRKAGHGKWGAWLKRECPDIGERTAQVYMQLHEYREVLQIRSASDLTIRIARELIQAHIEPAAPHHAPAIPAQASPSPARREPARAPAGEVEILPPESRTASVTSPPSGILHATQEPPEVVPRVTGAPMRSDAAEALRPMTADLIASRARIAELEAEVASLKAQLAAALEALAAAQKPAEAPGATEEPESSAQRWPDGASYLRYLETWLAQATDADDVEEQYRAERIIRNGLGVPMTEAEIEAATKMKLAALARLSAPPPPVDYRRIAEPGSLLKKDKPSAFSGIARPNRPH